MSQTELTSPASDGITSVQFSPTSTNHYLLSASWDCSLRLHDVDENVLLASSDFSSPLLDCCWDTETSCFVASLDGAITMIDWVSGTSSHIGQHSASARCVAAHQTYGAIVSCSWDGSIHVYDPRTPEDTMMGKVENGGERCYSLSLSEGGFHFVVAGNDRKISIYDMRTLEREVRESALQHQTRCVRTTPLAFAPSHESSVGYTISSIEGRIACQYFEDNLTEHGAVLTPYAFKCHRQPSRHSSLQVAYPVNTIAYHPIYGTFASGGADGIVNVWDQHAKKRVCQYAPFESSISALAFSPDGERLAVASSYTYERGADASMKGKDKIFVRKVNPIEVTPKTRPVN